MTKFNPNTLKPGDEVNTLRGPAIFVEFKPNNLRGQTYRVRFKHNGQLHWYTEDQLRQANREQAQDPVKTPIQPTQYDLRAML